MKDEKPQSLKSVALLKIKLTNPPDEELTRIAKLVRRGRNSGLEDWLLRQRGKQESDKQGSIKVARRKKGFVGPLEKKGITPSTKIYHAVCKSVPELGTDVCSRIASDVWSNVNAKVDWRQQGDDKALLRSDLILDYEYRPPWYTTMDVPVANKHAKIEFINDLQLSVGNILKDKSRLELEFSMKGFPPRLKKLIRRVMATEDNVRAFTANGGTRSKYVLQDGESKFSDSFLTLKDDDWYWYWPITIRQKIVFDPENIAVLCPQFSVDDGNNQSDRPFTILRNGKSTFIGDGYYLIAQTHRLVGLRKAIGYRYRSQLAKGHGRKKYDKAMSMRLNQLHNVNCEVRHRIVNDVVKQCQYNNCGKLVYREPTGPVKTKCWFDVNGLDFDWTSFITDLKNTCHRKGIIVSVEKLKIKEVLEGAAA